MSVGRQALVWLGLLAAFVLILELLSPVLLPFAAGLMVAYLLDPLVDRLQRRVSRAAATTIVSVAFFGGLIGATVLLLPLLQQQVVAVIEQLVAAGGKLYELARPYVERVISQARQGGPGSLSGAGDFAGQAVAWAGQVAGRVWSGGLALFNLLSLVFITPIVTFYLVRDWDKIVTAVDRWLPRRHADDIRMLCRRIDARMAGFIRGQALVCVLLGMFYAVGLTAVGLDNGLLVGLLTGAFSFVPYVGMMAGMAAGMTIAFLQYSDWLMPAVVLGVFALGQFIEGNFVTPKLVGERVGLHPVWVMLAVLAGGALFGVLGVLLSVPVAAAIGELGRYGLDRYLASSLYTGEPRRPHDDGPGPAA